VSSFLLAAFVLQNGQRVQAVEAASHQRRQLVITEIPEEKAVK
jgi:hypothetical protein